MTQRLHASLKPHIVVAIASSVRLQRTCRHSRMIGKSGALEPLPDQRQASKTPIKELLDGMAHCRGCEAGWTGCFEGNVRSCLLREKPASARPLSSTRSPVASLPVETFGSFEGNVWNSTG